MRYFHGYVALLQTNHFLRSVRLSQVKTKAVKKIGKLKVITFVQQVCKATTDNHLASCSICSPDFNSFGL